MYIFPAIISGLPTKTFGHIHRYATTRKELAGMTRNTLSCASRAELKGLAQRNGRSGSLELCECLPEQDRQQREGEKLQRESCTCPVERPMQKTPARCIDRGSERGKLLDLHVTSQTATRSRLVRAPTVVDRCRPAAGLYVRPRAASDYSIRDKTTGT